MRHLMLTVPIATVALAAAGVLGSASADTTTTPTAAPSSAPPVLTVTGVGDTTVSSDAGQPAFSTAYRAQLTAALDDASAKAALVAAHEHVTLGAVQSITEQSAEPVGDCEAPYVGGLAEAGVAAPAPKTTTTKPKKTRKPKKHSSKAKAHGAAVHDDSGDDNVYPCDVEATVTVSYAIG